MGVELEWREKGEISDRQRTRQTHSVYRRFWSTYYVPRGLPGGSVVKASACQCETQEMPIWSLARKDPLEGSIWQSTPVFLPEKSHGLKSVRFQESDMTKHAHTVFYLWKSKFITKYSTLTVKAFMPKKYQRLVRILFPQCIQRPPK